MEIDKINYKGKDYSPKSIPDLMTHLRDNAGITMQDENARQLITYGYYHAYKGYRFFKKPKSFIPYTTFEQIIAVIDYDNDLKACFYSEIMFLETALKNIVVEKVLNGADNAGFEAIYKQKMSHDEGEGMQNNRNHLKDKIRQTIAKRYNQENPVIAHFHERGDAVPIWAIFEVLSLGDFAMFLSCLDSYVRTSLLRDLKMVVSADKNAMMLSYIVYTIKDLRNAIAHNNVIFDTRFKDREVEEAVSDWLMLETGIKGIDFGSIIDYYILVAVLLKKIEYKDSKLDRFCGRMRQIFDDLYDDTPTNIYVKLTTTNLITKLNGLSKYCE